MHDGDLVAINQRPDILGVNYYTPELIAAPIAGRVLGQVAHTPNAAPEPSRWPGSDRAWSMPQDGPYTDMGWRIEPAAFTELLERVGRDYPGLPIMITENGAAFADPIGADGVVHDADRIDYLDRHLRAVHDAISAGVDVRGYFVWSLMDNFEWAWGYAKTLRHRARRLRDAGAYAEGFRPLVPAVIARERPELAG